MSHPQSQWPEKAVYPLNKPALIMFTVSTALALTVLPWYAWNYDFSGAAWIAAVVLLYATGLSITAGYHRLWSHRTYEAHPLMRVFYMLFGSMALQNTILVWCATHRVHHRHVDDVDQDPYSIKRGFWFAHMGWMVRDYPSAEVDYANARDLTNDPIVMFQERHYLKIALAMNTIFPFMLGMIWGDPWGFLLLAGLARLVINHHFTFFINSLAHSWGRRPYTDSNTARDNDIVAFFTYGEGYHNFHHLYQWDYRNGIRWWQYDPTKWWIAAWSWVGATSKMKRVPEFLIQRALLERQFETAKQGIAVQTENRRLATVQRLLQNEWDAFSETLTEWREIQAEKIENAKQQVAEKVAENWEHSHMRRRLRVLEASLRLQRRRVRLIRLQFA